MTWRDNLRAASSEDGFIIAGGSGASLIPQNTNWHDNYMNSFTEDGIKIANLKDAVSQVETLPQEADTGSLYYLTTGANPGMYYYDGTEWVAVGGGGVTPEQLDARVKQMAGAPTTSTEGVVGQLIEDTENGELYQLTGTEGGSATVDTDAGLTSSVTNVTFTITNATTFNNKLSGFSLQAGTYVVVKGASNSFVVTSGDGTTTYGTLTGIAAASLPNGLGVTPNPVATWMTAFSQAPVGRPFFTFNMVAGGSLSYIWEKVGGGPTVVQTTGSSTTDVMSQDAVSGLLFVDKSLRERIKIGAGASGNASYMVSIGAYSQATANQTTSVGSLSMATGQFSTALGASAYALANQSTALGYYAHAQNSAESTAVGVSSTATGSASLAIGAYSTASNPGAVSFPYCEDGGAQGVVNFGPFNSSYGYNNTNYRLLTGVHDAQGDHDAVTLGQLNALITQLQALGLNVSLQGANNSGNSSSSAEPDPGTSAEPTVTCPNCQQQTSEMSPICEHCGYDLSGGGGESPDDPAEPAPEDAEAPAEG